MHYLGVFYNNALSQKILFKQEKKNVRGFFSERKQNP